MAAAASCSMTSLAIQAPIAIDRAKSALIICRKNIFAMSRDEIRQKQI
jgi:hypothetical protein